MDIPPLDSSSSKLNEFQLSCSTDTLLEVFDQCGENIASFVYGDKINEPAYQPNENGQPIHILGELSDILEPPPGFEEEEDNNDILGDDDDDTDSLPDLEPVEPVEEEDGNAPALAIAIAPAQEPANVPAEAPVQVNAIVWHANNQPFGLPFPPLFPLLDHDFLFRHSNHAYARQIMRPPSELRSREPGPYRRIAMEDMRFPNEFTIVGELSPTRLVVETPIPYKTYGLIIKIGWKKVHGRRILFHICMKILFRIQALGPIAFELTLLETARIIMSSYNDPQEIFDMIMESSDVECPYNNPTRRDISIESIVPVLKYFFPGQDVDGVLMEICKWADEATEKLLNDRTLPIPIPNNNWMIDIPNEGFAHLHGMMLAMYTKRSPEYLVWEMDFPRDIQQGRGGPTNIKMPRRDITERTRRKHIWVRFIRRGSRAEGADFIPELMAVYESFQPYNFIDR